MSQKSQVLLNKNFFHFISTFFSTSHIVTMIVTFSTPKDRQLRRFLPLCEASTGARASCCVFRPFASILIERRPESGCARSECRDSSEKRVWPFDKSLGFCALVLIRGRLSTPPEGLMNSRSLSRTGLHKAASENSLCGPRF